MTAHPAAVAVAVAVMVVLSISGMIDEGDAGRERRPPPPPKETRKREKDARSLRGQRTRLRPRPWHWRGTPIPAPLPAGHGTGGVHDGPAKMLLPRSGGSPTPTRCRAFRHRRAHSGPSGPPPSTPPGERARRPPPRLGHPFFRLHRSPLPDECLIATSGDCGCLLGRLPPPRRLLWHLRHEGGNARSSCRRDGPPRPVLPSAVCGGHQAAGHGVVGDGGEGGGEGYALRGRWMG